MADRDLCGLTLGEFVLREQIGAGGGGTVYRCFQPSLNRDAVVKVLREPRRRNDGAPERFLREAQLASRLDHPYAAHIYAFGAEPDGLLWIAMELVPGVTLDAWLREHGRIALEQFVPFFESVAEVVHAAHKRGIVHRDLKPSNVMVIESDGRLIPKLLDFGIAKAHLDTAMPGPESLAGGLIMARNEPGNPRNADGPVTRPDPIARDWHLTPSNAGIGSSPYMSPEQWGDARAVGPASDIYSLGVLAYEALTGRVPFAAESDGACYRRHLDADVPPLGGDFPPGLDRVIRRALAKTPEARPLSALALAAELREALRASERELLRTSAQQWAARDRAPGLLWGGDVLAEVDRWTQRAPSGVLSELERSFVAASRRRAQRRAWLRRLLVATVAVTALGIAVYRSILRARMAEDLVTQAEGEQGRQALLHGDLAEAQLHLAEADRRGDHSPGTAFMLARALEPRKAELARFPSTSGRMWSAAFSPDGSQIVTTDDRSGQVWDAATSRRLHVLPHEGTVFHAVYSADGAWIATAGGDGVVKIWNAASGDLVRELRRDGKRPQYYLVAVSTDRRLVAAVTKTGETTDVWAADTGALLSELSNPDALEYPAIAFSADGRWLATCGGGDMHVVDTTTWRSIFSVGSRIRSLSFDPGGSRLAIGTASGDAAIWAVPDGKRIRHLREVGESVDRIAWSPDGALVVAASRDGAEQVFDAASEALRSRGNYLHARIRSVEFDATSKLVLAAGTGGTVVVADAALGTPLVVLGGPRSDIRVAHFDPNARRIVTASSDGTARVWNATPPYRRWHSLPLTDECGVGTSLEPDRRFIAIGCIHHPTRVWDTAREVLLAELPSMPSTDGDFAPALPAVSAAGDRAAIARGHAVEVYALPGGALLRTINHGAPVTAVAFAGLGRDLLSGAADGSVLVTPAGGAEVALPLSAGGIDAAALLPDGRIVVADARKRLRVYATDHHTALADLPVPVRVGLLRLSEDGHRLVTIPSYLGEDAPPLLWDLERYRLVAELSGHVGRVFSARFVRGDHEILTVGGDGTACSWDATSGRLRNTYRGGLRYLADAALTPDGSMVVAGGGDGLVRYWDATTARQLWTMQAHKSAVIGIHFDGGDLVTRGDGGDVSRWTLPESPGTVELSAAPSK
jgi:WD40 repeat protein/serine/threonine protein kinase